MSISKSMPSGVWGRVLNEFKHAPLGTTAAVLAMGELAWGLIGIETGHQLRSASTLAPIDHIKGGQPSIVPILQFVVLQVVIAFVLHKVNAWISGAAVSARIAVCVPSTILAAYLTGWNAFYATLSEIAEGRHYGIFEGFWVGGFVFTVILLIALHLESVDVPATWAGSLSSVGIAVIPMALLFYLSCIFFDGGFMDSLQPIWSAVTHAASPQP